MIDEHDIERDFDEFDEDDAWLQGQLSGAFDRMTPSDDAQGRMLANILAAQADAAGEMAQVDNAVPASNALAGAAGGASANSPDNAALSTRPKTKRRRRPLYKIVVPAAAACAACAIAVGVLLGPGGGQPDTVANRESGVVSYESSIATEQEAENAAASDEAIVPTASNAAVTDMAEAPRYTAAISDVTYIELQDGSMLEPVVDTKLITIAVVDEARVGEFVEIAQAYSYDDELVADCEVYRVVDDPDAYAILLEGHEEYLLAR